MKTKSVSIRAIAGLALLLLNTAATGEMVGIETSKETLSKTYAGKAYSPYAQRSFTAFPSIGSSGPLDLYEYLETLS
jgi:hypothetical protein